MATLTCYDLEATVPGFPAFPELDELRLAAATPPRPGRVIALIPVHNEHGQLSFTLDAVFGQTRPPDEVYVLTDNAEDTLAEEAAWFPVSITSTVGNRDKKAGNLNRCLAMLLPWLEPEDVIVGFDADSVPSADFIENALAWIGRGYGAVGATFHGRAGGGFLGLLQRAEFARFARHQHRKAHCDVLSGTGWAVPVSVMRQVAASRPEGQVYDVAAIVEDYELTLRIKSLGIATVSPSDCLVLTDVMETAADWTTQRLRWQYGTLIALSHYGWNRVTHWQILRQALTYLAMLATPLVLVYLGWSFELFGWRGIDPANAPYYFAGIAGVVGEQAYQARRAGWLAVLSTLLVVPDFLYSLARQYIYLRAAYRAATRKDIVWGAGTSL
jgi:cellulose synthase/poly-beta-1,6-N-acetylglucosamine synthase-like glycosyltransferase